MLPVLAILLPLALAMVVYLTPSKLWRPRLLAAGTLVHLSISVELFRNPVPPETGLDWLMLDASGRLLLVLVSVLFACCGVYSVGYLRYRVERENRRFTACMLAALGTMSLVAQAQHLALLWVALEATTLATAPLIYFNRTARSIEATWKFLMLSSVGIALALLGSFFVGYAALLGGGEASLSFSHLMSSAENLSRPWLRMGFVLLAVGYGTKLGLVPMHTWKPDAYGEAPGVVGAVLSGGSTACAFLALRRLHEVCVAAGEAAFAGQLLLGLGFVSMGVAGALLLGQRDLKRALAYSSVEQMGILSLATGLGPIAGFATWFHLVSNALAKGAMFLVVGNVHRAFGGKTTDEIRGALERLPFSSGLLLVAFFALTGSPPFPLFLSELMIVSVLIETKRFVMAAVFVLFLLLVFAGMGMTLLAALQGRPPARCWESPYRDRWTTVGPPVMLLALLLVLGLLQPELVRSRLAEAAAAWGVRP